MSRATLTVLLLLFVACGGQAADRQRETTRAPGPVPPRPADSWCVRSAAEPSGEPVFITINLGYKGYRHLRAFPYLVHVNVTVVDRNANGHPTAAEANVLNQVEDGITEKLTAAVTTAFVGRVTASGSRELMYYVSDPKVAHAALEAWGRAPQQRAWEYRIVEDPSWAKVTPLLDHPSECVQ
jgi:hypothetical protein